MILKDTWFYKNIIGKQPYRFVLKSARNILLPAANSNIISKGITIEISSICNAKCIFCSYKKEYRAKKLMPLDSFTRIAISAVGLGYDNLDLTSPGGELFVHKDAIRIIETARNAGFKHIGTFTNAISIHSFDVMALLQSGIDVLIISFPGFDRQIYKELFGIDRYEEFEKSVVALLNMHRKLNSQVIIIFEPRTYLRLEEIKRSAFYSNFLSDYISPNVVMREPLRVFDSWGGEITKKDLIKGMKLDTNPVKSLWPLKEVYLCNRLQSFGVMANGDVRLCNCRYDSTIETDNDSLFIDNVKNYNSLADLLTKKEYTIRLIKSNFRQGKLPALCTKCPFYIPVKLSGETEP